MCTRKRKNKTKTKKQKPRLFSKRTRSFIVVIVRTRANGEHLK